MSRLTARHQQLLSDIKTFCDTHLQGQKALTHCTEFPLGTWRQLGGTGLLGVGIPESLGGRGGDWLDIALLAEGLAYYGENLGFAFSATLQATIARFCFLGFGDDRQQRLYLPDLASGKTIVSLAMSEPKTGAHPKHMATTARIEEGYYYLTGEKTYLTNGPVADCFVVIAVTGESGGKKQFSAFITPRQTPGLQILPPMNVPFFKPAVHGGIVLKDCRLPPESILGTPGRAYTEMVRAFREVEDSVMMGAAVGAGRRLMELLGQWISRRVNTPDDETKACLGKLSALLETVRLIGRETAELLNNTDETQSKRQTALTLAARELQRYVGQDLEALNGNFPENPDPVYRRLKEDLGAMAAIAGKAETIKKIKLGEELLSLYRPAKSAR